MSAAALTVLTYNVGLLQIRLLGRTLLEVPHVGERLARLGPALLAGGGDVLCLQEVFRPEHRAALVAALAPRFPHVARHDDRRRLLTHGLLVLSRHRLSDTSFTPFSAQDPWQVLAVRQGVLAATVDVPHVGPVRVLDVHATAGGARGPERPRVERLRERQLEQLHRLAAAAGSPTLLCGDLNAGPEASAGNYRRLLARGYVDAFVEGGGTGTTWDPQNELNRGGVFRGSPGQRVDHVLLDAAAAQRFRVLSADVVHADRVVEVAGQRTTLSDHYGVQVAMALR